MRSALPLVAALSLACAKPQLPPVAPVAQMSPEREARCRAVADSVFANVPPEQLPEAGPPTSRPPHVALRVPQSVPPGVPVNVAYLVRPDGSADTTTVSVDGTDDARFRRDALKLISQVTLTPAMIDGCPVWSHTTISAVRSGIIREVTRMRP